MSDLRLCAPDQTKHGLLCLGQLFTLAEHQMIYLNFLVLVDPQGIAIFQANMSTLARVLPLTAACWTGLAWTTRTFGADLHVKQNFEI